MFKLKYVLGKHDKAVSSIKFSPCGSFIATCGADQIINIYYKLNLNQ